MAQEITDFFPNIGALERGSMLLLDSLSLQQKDIVNNRKERRCNERADVRAVESTGVNTELALRAQTPGLQRKSWLLLSKRTRSEERPPGHCPGTSPLRGDTGAQKTYIKA